MNTRLLRKRNQPPPHPVLRITRIVAGALLVVLGVILSIPLVPGQGILTVLAGLWLMSADVRLARRALIRIRIMGRRTRKRYRTWREARRKASS